MGSLTKQDTKRIETYTNIKVKCPRCGHTQVIPVYLDSNNCSYCGKKLRNNTRLYFKYKLRKELNK
jgi:ribosomal protein L37AE/L43A